MLRKVIRALRAANLQEDTAWHDPELPPVEDRVRAGDLEAGRSLLAGARDDHELRALRVGRLTKAAAGRVDELTRLSTERPEDADLALWLGATRIQHAWNVRSAATANNVSREQFERFWFILGGAHAPLVRAAELRPDDPNPWDQLQWRGLGLQVDRAELDDVWRELHTRDAVHYAGHFSRVQVLCAKWFGSNDEVLEFANSMADAAPPGEPLGAILVAAHVEVMLDKERYPTSYFGTPSIRDRIVRLADDWTANQRPHVRTPEAHHLYGAALYLAGDYHRARRHLAEVSRDSVPKLLPWGYLDAYDSDLRYREVRKNLGLP